MTSESIRWIQTGAKYIYFYGTYNSFMQYFYQFLRRCLRFPFFFFEWILTMYVCFQMYFVCLFVYSFNLYDVNWMTNDKIDDKTNIIFKCKPNKWTAPACNAELSGSPFDDVLLLLWSVVGLTLPPCIHKLSSLTFNSASAAPRYKLKIFVSQRTNNLRFCGVIMWLSIRTIKSDHASFEFVSFTVNWIISFVWTKRKPTLLD